jgi:nicotinate (nicotinamide) nucleotide adenylyltransferase
MRIGVFGGTFDPPHVGHLALAEWAREALRLDRVLFVPAGRPPHKGRRVLTPVAHRVAMTRLAVRGQRAFVVSALEARRNGPSFTVDTLRALRKREPGARIFLLMGADSLAEFPTWRDPAGILGFATLAVAARPGTRGRAAARARAPGRRGCAGRASCRVAPEPGARGVVERDPDAAARGPHGALPGPRRRGALHRAPPPLPLRRP